MNRKTLILTFVGILLVIAAAVALSGKLGPKSSATPSPTAAVSAVPLGTEAASVAPAASIPVVTFSGSSFSPAETTVKSGGQITFKNNSQDNLAVDSDPHPAHTSDADLNVGMIAPGQSKTVTLTKKGTFGIHDHLNPSITAKITVQ